MTWGMPVLRGGNMRERVHQRVDRRNDRIATGYSKCAPG